MATGSPSQNFVDIKEIRDGVIMLKDGTMRAILMTSSVNLSLKSIDEQEATILQFQNFLNTLDFEIQISVQSRKMDIRPYLNLLESRYEEIKQELLRVQTREYIEFIRWFSEQNDIMSKTFLVTIPYEGAIISQGKNTGIMSMFSSKKTVTEANTEAFEQKRVQLEQRIGIVKSGLTRLGIRVQQLNTEEIIELFYAAYNPGDEERKVKNVNAEA